MESQDDGLVRATEDIRKERGYGQREPCSSLPEVEYRRKGEVGENHQAGCMSMDCVFISHTQM